MLRPFIRRRSRSSDERSSEAGSSDAGAPVSPTPVAPAGASTPRATRRADWLIGGSIATLAVAFVAGLLGLRSSTAELQDQSRTATRDLAALRADTAERINGIADDLAKTNRTLTDLLALRGADGAAGKAADKAGDNRTAPVKAGDGKLAEGKSAGTAGGEAKGTGGSKEAAPRAAATAATKPAAARLGQITVPRPPERAREPQARRPVASPRPALATRVEPRSPAEALRLRREEVLRRLRLRRLAQRGT